MIVVINHLTRMSKGNVCVAGVDLRTSQHVRPILQWDQLTSDVLARNNGPCDIANVVDLGAAIHIPKPPHIEDHAFRPSWAKLVERCDAETFWALLHSVSKPKLRDIFGDELKLIGQTSCGTELGKGEASLGCLRPSRRPRLRYFYDGRFGKPRIRINVDDGTFDAWVGVTDLRLYKNDLVTPDRQVVEKVSGRLQQSGAVILAVGLTRPYSSSSRHKAEPSHWLQVNNIHLETDPVWQLR